MKFRLGKALWHSSDATSGYEVEIIKGGTVREFIDEVLKNEEWGYIGIKAERSIFGEPYIRYKDDAITTDIEDMKPFLEKKIAKIHASGGWSRMDYLLEVEERGAVDMESREYVNIPMMVLLETMRHRACPRPDFGDENWIRVIECMPEIIRVAEEFWNSTDCNYELWEGWKREREEAGEELVSIMP